MNTIRQKTLRRSRLAMIMAVALVVPLAVQVVVGIPASAVDGLRRVVNRDDKLSSFLWREAVARCDRGEVVVGGGAVIVSADGNDVRLTDMYPLDDHRFMARAEEPDTGYAGVWRLETYAVCASTPTVQGYELPPPERSGESSSVFKHQTAGCPGNKKVIGTGAQILHENGQVGLTMMRPAGPLDIARAAAREDTDGYAQNWELLTYAICANRIESAAVYGTARDESFAVFSCPPDKFVYSVGGGGGITDSGPYFLRQVFMNASLTGGSIFMSGPPDGGIGAGATCAFVL